MKTSIIITVIVLVFIPTAYGTNTINNVRWSADLPINVIEVLFDEFPAQWDTTTWTMYVDGKEWPTIGVSGDPSIRPSAPIGEATGFWIGAEPWLSSLKGTNFPCCGTIQFSIPGQGLTNVFQYNLIRQECETTSPKTCEARFLNVIENQAQYDELLGEEGYIKYLAPIRAIPAKEPFTEECYFQDMKKYSFHPFFIRSFKEFESIKGSQYTEYAGNRATRIWWSGAVQFMNNSKTLGYTIWTADSILQENDIIEVDNILKKNIPYAKTMLAFVPANNEQYSFVINFKDDLKSKGVNVELL